MSLSIKNQTLFLSIVSAAIVSATTLGKTDGIAKRWITAINKAVDQIEAHGTFMEWMPDTKSLIIFSQDSNKIYSTNGVCQCLAYERDTPCWHRAAARLVRLYMESLEAMPVLLETVEGALSYLPNTSTKKSEIVGGCRI